MKTNYDVNTLGRGKQARVRIFILKIKLPKPNYVTEDRGGRHSRVSAPVSKYLFNLLFCYL